MLKPAGAPRPSKSSDTPVSSRPRWLGVGTGSIMAKDAEGPKLSSLKYLVSSVISSGKHGTVALIAAKEAGGGRYALRVLKREDENDDLPIEMARAEHAASEKVNHKAILKVYDFRTRRSFFKVNRAEQLMEYVEGKTLDGWENFPVRAGILVFHQAASALAHMHRRGVSHGLMEPGRLMLSRTGHVKVRGYGFSEVEKSFRDKIKPNASYCAPEQVKEKTANPKTELYALGATMYHILTGRPPIVSAVGGRPEGKKIPTPTTLNPQIPTPLNNILVTCLQTDPHRRPEDMYEVVKQLEGLITHLKLDEELLVGLAAKEE
jgi:serine/threonine-protein kinase